MSDPEADLDPGADEVLGPRVRLRAPRERDESAFLEAVARSRDVHAEWVTPPTTATAFAGFLQRARQQDRELRLAWRGDDLVGVANLNDIVRGNLQGAQIGYYGFVPFVGQGLMCQALSRLLDEAFGPLRLHRVEANVQPDNLPSRALVERLGFRLEGHSPRYLLVAGRWRDHERWAMLADEWRTEHPPTA